MIVFEIPILYYKEGDYVVSKQSWILCPICGNKTRTRILKNTELVNFPLFCPKCRNETIVNVKHGILKAIKEPDAKTQSQ